MDDGEGLPPSSLWWSAALENSSVQTAQHALLLLWVSEHHLNVHSPIHIRA
jgi:hypothetical protein